jgi:hypothetical protein
MEATGESYVTNRDCDAFFSGDFVRELAGIFLGEGGNPRDPLANPCTPTCLAWDHLHPSGRRRGPSG